MRNPEFIRVAGHLYQRRKVQFKHPRFIQVRGTLYRLSQTGTEHVEAVGALEKLAAFLQKLATASAGKNQQVQTMMSKAGQEVTALAVKLAKSEPAEQAAALKDWTALKDGLQGFATKAQQSNLVKLHKAVTDLLTKVDTAVTGLSKAEGLDFVGKEIETSPKPTGVDWGDAGKPAQQQPAQAPQQKAQASVSHPLHIQVRGHLYKLVG